MSIRFKVVAAVIVLLALAGGAVAWTTQRVYDAAIDDAAQSTVRIAAESFATLERQDVEKLSAVNDTLRARDDLRELFVARDRDGLYEATAPLFEQLKTDYAITHLYFEEPEPDSRVFLRVHNPDKFDDVVSRDTYRMAVEAGTYGAGKDLGLTAFALRVVHPWTDDANNVIGYVETGQEIEQFLDIMADESGDHLALVLQKDALDGEEWAVMRENRGEENNWDDHEDLVVAHTTSEQVDAEDLEQLDIAALSEEGNVFRREEEEGVPFVVGAFPVVDTTGERVGAVLVEHDNSGIVGHLSSARNQTLALLAALGGLIVVVILLMLNSLVFNRLSQMIDHMRDASVRLAGGDFDIAGSASSANDEIGEFERFFDEFLGVIASTLKQLVNK